MWRKRSGGGVGCSLITPQKETGRWQVPPQLPALHSSLLSGHGGTCQSNHSDRRVCVQRCSTHNNVTLSLVIMNRLGKWMFV